jgi:anaerobic magnesium-protoporphyrin IX monomethyl ester cyclase
MMKFLVLNLPSKHRLTRRYMCSYESTTHLFPPLELLSCAAVVRSFSNTVVTFVDSIAESHSTFDVLNLTIQLQPDYIITLIGFECFEEDIAVISAIKNSAPHSKIIAFGHYPTIFKQEILRQSDIDIILEGEPEIMLAQFLSQSFEYGSGINLTTTNNDFSQTASRIRYIKDLPAPAYDLLKGDQYSEVLMPKPFGMVQTARGCPYSCNYCVRSYGARLSLRSPEQVVEEIEHLIELHNIKSLRFIDDTFTVNPQRVKDICQLMIDRNIRLKWTCLSRTDNIRQDMLVYMKRAGCQRIYFGVESGSQRMLDIYEKGTNVEESRTALKLTREAGIETTGFFMLGLPDETEEDFRQTIDFAINSNLSLAAVGGIVLYPGTPLFKRYEDQIQFSLFPYQNRFLNNDIEARYKIWEKTFYHRFYFRPGYVLNMAAQLAFQPRISFETIKNVLNSNLNFEFVPGIKKLN